MGRIVGYALLCAVAVSLAMAGTANAASVVVVDEASGEGCDVCLVHVTGESHWADPGTGVVVHSCEDELFAFLMAGGTGGATWVGTAHAGPGCGLTNCMSPEASWSITATTEPSSGQERLAMRICVRSIALGADFHCNVSAVVGHPEPHLQQLTILSLCFGGARRLEADWLVEDSKMELVHQAE